MTSRSFSHRGATRTTLAPGRGEHRTRVRRAISLAETLISIVLVGGVLVVALNTAGSAVLGRHHISEKAQAELLAHDLMAEILQQDFEEPDDTPLFGREGGENSAARADYDDVDDYLDWDSTPFLRQDGTQILGTVNWGRSVTVEWLDPLNLTTVSMTPTNVKRITVDVACRGQPVAQLVAVRTIGLPLPATGPVVLIVVGNTANLTAEESARVTLLEFWGFRAQLIAASATAADFLAATADAVVAYVPSTASELQLGTKLRDATIGVVNGNAEMTDEFGFASQVVYTDVQDVKIVDSVHYITQGYPVAFITLFTTTQNVFVLGEPTSIALSTLAETSLGGPNEYVSLSVLETGGALIGGGTAAARRVQLPWGGDTFDIDALNADGQTLLKRSIEWAANLEQP